MRRFASLLSVLLLLLLCAAVRFASVRGSESRASEPLDAETVDPKTGFYLVDVITLGTDVLGMVIASSVALGVLFTLAFWAVWVTKVQDKRGRKPLTSARETLAKQQQYSAVQDSPASCAIM